MDLLQKKNRQQFLNDVVLNENRIRKAQSLAAFEVYNDRLDRYVTDYLRSQYEEKTVLEMPIITTVNLCKRIANKEASLYRSAPKREFYGSLTDDQKDELNKLYEESEVDAKLFKSNVFYKIQGQNFIKVLVKPSEDGDGGELCIKTLLPHHLDVIPTEDDPEKADTYVQSAFDKRQYIKTDGTNQSIADADDYRAKLNKYYVWTKEANFMFDGQANIQSEIVQNPIGMLPFIDVSGDKDYEFFVRIGQALVDFTIQYNGALSDLAQVVKMQGWAVAFLKAPQDMAGLKNLSIGPNKILHLPIDPNNPVTTEFGYASANPDVAGSIQHVETLLSNFLTSRGIDPSLVNGKAQIIKYNSGIDRLLSMVEQFESSKQDMIVYSCVEDQLFDLIREWSKVTFGTENQFLSFVIPDDVEIEVEFEEPKMVQTQKDKLDYLQSKIELGLTTKQMALEELDDLDKEQAAAVLEEIAKENAMPIVGQQQIIAKGNAVINPNMPPMTMDQHMQHMNQGMMNEAKANNNNGQGKP